MTESKTTTLIQYVTRTQFGFGASALLKDELEALGVRYPLVVTDKGVVAAGLVDRVMASLLHQVFDDTPSNPTEAAARAAVDRYTQFSCDGIVAIGGGSPLDLAKVVGLMLRHSGPLSNYAIVNGGLSRIKPQMPPVVAVPTTAGTGSEVARAAVVIMQGGRKLVVASPHLVPKLAICDPELTLGLPPGMTAATGFDAIAHCVETFCSPVENPPASAIALDGLKRLAANIERAVQEPGHRQARWEMMMGGLQGGLTFQKGLGAVHALSHPLGEYGFHHGTLNAILLPHVLVFNREALQDKPAALATAMGLSPGVTVDRGIAAMLPRLGLPSNLSSLGFSSADIADVAHKAEVDSCNATNPRKASAADYETLLAAASN